MSYQRTLYFECNMGAAGDMFMAALLDLHKDPDGFLIRLNNIGIPKVKVTSAPSVKHGITGRSVSVEIGGHEEHSHDHHHSKTVEDKPGSGLPSHHLHGHSHDGANEGSLSHIEHLIGHLNISDSIKENALAVYGLIAEAESSAHGVPVDKIHFHEVGEMDAVADIVGVCMLIDELAPDLIMASAVNVGSGFVRCAHGVFPVPAPATAKILRNTPIYNDGIKGELCTPTGAALLKHFADSFDNMSVMKAEDIGYGMGKKDFNRVNCVRAYIGATSIDDDYDDEVSELVCNLDDMTPEAVAFAQQLLLDEGALDVYITPIIMKKGRAGVMFTCMCSGNMKDKMLSLIFKHTTTLGIREIPGCRYTLKREHTIVHTEKGAVRIKNACGYGVKKSKPEYDDIAKIARENGLTLQEAVELMR